MKRKTYAIRLQVVCAVSPDVAPIGEQEGGLIEEAFRSAARHLSCEIVGASWGGRWFQLMLATDTAFDVARAMTSLKAVTSRAVREQRGGKSGFWAPGYVVVSVGDPVDPEEAAAELSRKANRN